MRRFAEAETFAIAEKAVKAQRAQRAIIGKKRGVGNTGQLPTENEAFYFTTLMDAAWQLGRAGERTQPGARLRRWRCSAKGCRDRRRAQRGRGKGRSHRRYLQARFAQYFDPVQPRALNGTQVIALMQPDEALLLILPSQFGTRVIAVSSSV